jgi:hypothetical protein
MVKMTMNIEQVRIWKGDVMVFSRYYPVFGEILGKS